MPFFDIEDAYHVLIDLWLAAAVALDVMKLWREVNMGRDVIEFTDGFDGHLMVLESRTAVLLDELKSTKRYQKAEAVRRAEEVGD